MMNSAIPAGDYVLKSVSEEVSKTIRANDTLYRYGGEEFLLMLLDTPLEGAVVVAEKIRANIEGLKMEFRGVSRRQSRRLAWPVIRIMARRSRRLSRLWMRRCTARKVRGATSFPLQKRAIKQKGGVQNTRPMAHTPTPMNKKWRRVPQLEQRHAHPTCHLHVSRKC